MSLKFKDEKWQDEESSSYHAFRVWRNKMTKRFGVSIFLIENPELGEKNGKWVAFGWMFRESILDSPVFETRKEAKAHADERLKEVIGEVKNGRRSWWSGNLIKAVETAEGAQ